MKEKFLSIIISLIILISVLVPSFTVSAAEEVSESTLPAGTAGYVMDVPETEQFLKFRSGTTYYFYQYSSRFLMKDTTENAADPFNAQEYESGGGGLYIRDLGGETYMLINPQEVTVSGGELEYVDGTANINTSYGKIQRAAGRVYFNNISSIENSAVTVDSAGFAAIDDATEDSITHLAFRIKVVGGTKDQLSTFQFYDNSGSKISFDYANIYFVDAKTGTATKSTCTGSAVDLPCGDFDGYMVIPTTTAALTSIKATTSFQFFLENTGSDYYNYSDWTGRTLCLGDTYAVTDYDTFVAGLENAEEEPVVENAKDVLTVPSAGGKISFNQSYDNYTTGDYNCGMPRYPEPNFMKSAVSVTVDGENFFPYTVTGTDKLYTAGKSKYYTLFKPANYTLNIPYYVVTDGVQTTTRSDRYPISDIYSDASDYNFVAMRFKSLDGTENAASTMSLCVGSYAKDAAGAIDLAGTIVINYTDNTTTTLESGTVLTVPYNFDGWFIVPSSAVGAVKVAGYIFYPDESDSWLNKNLYFGDIKIVKDGDAFVSELTDCEKSGGHALEAAEAQAPTAESTGHIAHYVCSKCEKTFEDSEGNTETNPKRLSFDAASLSLYQSISVNFKARVKNLEDFEDIYAKLTLDGKQSVVYGEREGEEYVFTLDHLLPEKFGKTITAQIFGTYLDGEEYKGEQITYSVKQYCYNKLSEYADADDKDDFKGLLVDILNYGAAAQVYTGIDTDNLVNKDLTVAEKRLATKTPVVTGGLRGVYNDIDETVSWVSANVRFEDTVGLMFTFSAEKTEGLSVKVYDAKTDGNLLAQITSFTKDASGNYTAFFGGLDATEMRKTVYVSVYDGTTRVSEILAYDIVSYAAVKIAITQSEATERQKNLRQLVIAMIKYGDAATVYKTQNSDGLTSVNGTHLYLPYTAFATDMGTFRLEGGNSTYLYGQAGYQGTRYPATALIEVPKSATYYVWGYAKDYTSNSQGSRYAHLAVNGSQLPNKIGQHGANEDTGSSGSFGWTLAGSIKLKAGKNTVGVVDTSNNYARVGAVLLTTNEYFTGFEQGSVGNAADYTATVYEDIVDISTVSSYGNKIGYTIKNRTDNDLASAVVVVTVYDENGVEVGRNEETIENLAANTSAERTEIVLSVEGEWTKGKIAVLESLESTEPLSEAEFEFLSEDYANPDDNAGSDFGTVTSYMLDYTYTNTVYQNEYYNRGGLSNTLSKLQKGEDVTIAYVGGSITQMDTWRTYTTKWFEETYSGNITEVNIGLAGTNADLAVCRIEQDVLVHNPDLVFIEYAVNGGAAKDMEGMILKTWQHDPTTDVCFVYTTTTSNYSIYSSGELPKYAGIYEEVAKWYNIPTVFFGNQAFDLYEQGKLTLSASSAEDGKILYTTDGVHLTADGGFLSAGAIARSIVNMEKTFDKDSYTITDHTIPTETYDDAPWTDATYSADWSKMKFEGEWLDCSLDESGNFQNFDYSGGYKYIFQQLFPTMQGTKTAGSSIAVKFRGTDIGIFEAGGQYSGQLRVIVDGVELDEKLVLYNKYYDSYLRHQYYFINSLPEGEHTVTFILDSEMPDKSALANKYPSDTTYEKNELYIGRILLNGELLDANE
ncbi:MAG: hypothetical protein IJ027_03115 [Oscillospiraceae bacterium]|nr:hypothetical protein [Oscillospiraceae bacterium]